MTGIGRKLVATCLFLPALAATAGCGLSNGGGNDHGTAVPGSPTLQAVPATPQLTPVGEILAHKFLLGWYSDQRTAKRRLTAYARAGVNLLVAPYGSEARTRKLLDQLHRYRIGVLLQPDATWIEKGNVSALQAFVRRFNGDGSVYGWYLYDEPDFNGLPPRRLRAAYRAIRHVDRHPVAVVFTTGNCVFGPGHIDSRYLTGFDLLMFDRYPFYTNLPGVKPLQDAGMIDANCVQSARSYHKEGPLMVLQGFGAGLKDGPFVWRDPTYRESACQFALARRAGAAGILFWRDDRADVTVQHNVASIMIRSHTGAVTGSPTVSPSNC